MTVYVVKTVYDDEYGGYEIDFITTNKQKAEDYCIKNNYPYEHWSGKIYDSIYYDCYEIED